jgi:hypothetical protein
MSDYPWEWTTQNNTSITGSISNIPLNPDQYVWMNPPVSYTYVTPTTRWVDYEQWVFQKDVHDYSAFWDTSYKRKLRSCIRTI